MNPFEIRYAVFLFDDEEILHHKEFFSKAEMKMYADTQKGGFIEACWIDLNNSKYLIWIERDYSGIEWEDNFSTEALYLIKNYLFPDTDWMHKNR
jgi:hypothetical protein